MLTIEFIKNNLEAVKRNVVQRGFDPKKADIDKVLEIDKQKNMLQTEADLLRQRRNENTQKMKTTGGKPSLEIISEGKELKEKISKLDADLDIVKKEWSNIMGWIPNMAFEETPIGAGPKDNIEIKAWSKQTGYLDKDKLSGAEGSAEFLYQYGSNADQEFPALPHWELGKKHDIIDLEAGSKVSGSRFYYLKKEGQLLMYGVFDLLMKKLLDDNFMPMYVPLLVKDRALFGSSQFPADQDQIYKIENANIEDNSGLYLIGSSEPSLFSYYQDNVIPNSEMPVKMFATTTCFRSEAGSWGKDVRGIKRVHQFEKLEMDVVMENNKEEAIRMHDYLLSLNEWLLQTLELPYHVINMCTGDLGYAAAAKKYDVEVYMPSSRSFTEIMSDSITTDYQSRRLNIKYVDKNNDKQYAYTINDTGATHRLLIAIIEHYQQVDGKIKVPAALIPYTRKEFIG